MKRNGFTLIEVMVVTTIIAILAAVGMVSYQTANQKARDGKRKADMEQIRSALEMYKADSATNAYPATANFSALVSPIAYIREIPNPPPNSSPATYQGGYTCPYPNGGSASQYELCQRLEANPSASPYCVYNP